ncbi:hypothetical protein [Candidatus Poriferisocius sp.]|uniref:hypothetical protein n=1 Tax=Candidatus Poriferisocius sp. TaxID=3101276 RepID=UPI003B5B4BEA
MKDLEDRGVSRTHPGFDLLSIRGGEIDRLIELKSSGVDAKVQAMSWNEWKSASDRTPFFGPGVMRVFSGCFLPIGLRIRLG